MAPRLPIVGIGASAGGIEALASLFRAMPNGHGMALVVVTHLPRHRESLLPEILGRATAMPVVAAQNDQTVAAEHVYVLPPGATLTIAEGRLKLHAGDSEARTRLPIDLFFTALAADQGAHAIGIVLSGGGSDGTLGLKAIKEHGGLTIAQGKKDSQPRFADMPQSAVAAGFVDLVLPVEEIPARLVEYVQKWDRFLPERPADALSRIHRLLHALTGHDFSQYREQTFQRRVQRRMQVAQIERIEFYVARLEEDANEVNALFRDLLIGVTGFFRDPAAFRALATMAIPQIFAGKGAADEVRIWVPGVATGEEAYSLAILCAERLGRSSAQPKLVIFGTDIDKAALAVARLGRYPADLLKDVSPERIARFFTAEAGTYQIAKELREMCIFSTHSLIRDPPFSRLDLISCRNLLIYPKTPLQDQIVPLLHYALRPGGFLFLGLSENVSRFPELFQPIDQKFRLFQSRSLMARSAVPLAPFLPHARGGGASPGDAEGAPRYRAEALRRFSAALIESFAPVHVIVDGRGEVLFEKELQETRERLRSTIEELETANEEFRATNEELVSLNEKLQTSKEELQSVNEELQTVNTELNAKVEEVDRANSDLHNFIQSTQIATVFLDRNLVIRNFTPAVTRIFSLIASDRGRPLGDIVSRIDCPELEGDMRRVFGSGAAIERAVTASDGQAHYLARILPYRVNGNAIDGVILTFVDVTGLVAAEEQQKMLAGELNHRVKNMLAVICSITERTLPALPTGTAKETLLGRFHALALTHDLLTRTRWTDLPLRDLVGAELAPYADAERGAVRIDGPPVMLKPRVAMSLALVIHELTTNAAKYGALSVESGGVGVTWTITGSDPARLQLLWVEHNGPEVANLAKRGFGTELIEHSIPFELQGEAKLEVIDKSVHCTILIPEGPEHFTFGAGVSTA